MFLFDFDPWLPGYVEKILSYLDPRVRLAPSTSKAQNLESFIDIVCNPSDHDRFFVPRQNMFTVEDFDFSGTEAETKRKQKRILSCLLELGHAVEVSSGLLAANYR